MHLEKVQGRAAGMITDTQLKWQFVIGVQAEKVNRKEIQGNFALVQYWNEASSGEKHLEK